MESHPNYEVLEVIGRGEAATVYRARDVQLKRFVAIKELHERLRRDPRQMEHFWEEAQFLANLEHENIVQVFGIEKERGWIVMELMRGSLDTKLAQGPVPYDLVRSVLRQTLEGLKHLHEQGKLHGAVKPANLLINDQGRVKLSDSAGIGDGGVVRKPIGASFKYLAPELANAALGAVTPAVDLYGVGFTALELLQGPAFAELFPGVGPDAVDPELAWMRWHASLDERLPPLEKLMPKLPADLMQVIGRLLEKEVAKRYASADEALEDLKNLPLQPVELPGMAAPKTKQEQLGGSAPPPPSKPEPRKQPVKPSKKPGDAPQPWSRAWINHKLEDKRILGGLCAAIAVPVLVFLFWPSTPDRVEVTLASVPAGAKITVGSQTLEKPTDTRVKLVSGKKYKVRLNLAGYKAKEETIEIKASKEPLEFKYTLEPDTRKVVIRSTPPRAAVFLDDKDKEVQTETTLELAVGKTYQLRLKKANYFDKVEEITVPAGEGDYPLEYRLKAKGTDLAGNSVEPIPKPKNVGKKDPDPSPNRPGRHFALLVGARDPASRLPEYVYANNDVDELAQVLPHAGYEARDVAVLKSDATATNLRERLQALCADKVAADVVLVVLVGNGNGGDFVPVGSDPAARNGLVPLRDVYEELGRCKARVKLVVVDACRPAPGIGAGITAATAGPPPEGVTALFACMTGQQSYRHLDWRHSVFMQAVIRGLAGEANTNSDQVVQLSEFKRFVSAQVAQYVREQYPQQTAQTPEFIGTITSGAILARLDPVLVAFGRGCQALTKDDTASALKQFSTALTQDARFIPALLRRAEAQFYASAYVEAIRDCDAIVALDGQHVEALATRGESRYLTKQPAQEAAALSDLTKAISLTTNYPAPYNVRAQLHRKAKDYSQALADHEVAIRLAPLDPQLRNERGITWLESKQPTKAREDFEAAIKLNPKRWVFYLNMSKVYTWEGNTEQAAKWKSQSDKVKAGGPQ